MISNFFVVAEFFGAPGEVGEAEAAAEEEDSADEEDYEDEEEEDIELDDEFEEEDSPAVDEEEEEEEMPPAKKATKSPARKKAAPKTPPRKKAPAPAPAPSVDDVAAGMAGMTIRNHSYDMDPKFCFMLYTHLVDRREHIRVDFWTPTLTSESFRVKLHPDDNTKLQLFTVVPGAIVAEGRLDKTHADMGDFNSDTHLNTSYKQLARQIKTDYEDARNPDLVVMGKPQTVQLPFACEDEINFECVYQPNKIAGLRDMLGMNKQFHCNLSVNLISVEKPKEDVVPTYRVVDDSSDEEDGDGDQNMQNAAGGDG